MTWGKTAASLKHVAAAGLILFASVAGPAIPQTTDAPPPSSSAAAPVPDLHPFVPETKPANSAESHSTASSAPAAPKKSKPKPVAVAGVSSASATVASPAASGTLLGYPPASSAAAPPKPAALKPIAPAPTSQPVTTIVHAPGAPLSADDIETFTDSVVRTLMQRDHVMGVTVAIVQGNTPILLKGYGYDRLSPARRVDPGNSLFRIGSITKAFTWIVARQEVEAGRIRLDDPIGDYVPPDVYSEDARYKPVTMRTLMDHTAGYEDTSLGHLFQLNSAHIVDPDSYFRRHKPRRVRDPGEFSSYSNFGAALAATALTQTAKAKDVPSLMEARIFTPLGMDHTTLREPYDNSDPDIRNLPMPMSAALTQDLSDGYIWDGATYRAEPFDHALPLSGALGGSSTARDMARLMSLMLAGGQIDGVQLYNAQSANAFRAPMLTMPEGYNGWASGLMIRTSPSGHVTYGHAGATLWFNSSLVLVPDMNLGIFISTNTQTGGPLANSFANLLLDHLDGDIGRPPLMPSPSQAYAEHKDYYNALRGQYVSTRRAYGGLEGAITRLVNTVQVSVDRDGRLILDTPSGTSAFVPASATGFFNPQDAEDPGPASETGGLHFLFNPDGSRVTAIETASNTLRYERVGWVHSPQTVAFLTAIMLITCVVVILSLVRGPGRNDRPTEPQARAALVSAGLAVAWIAAIFIFNLWRGHVDDDPGSLLTDWPSGQVQFASWLALLATVGTLFQIGTYYFVYNESGRFSSVDGWAEWQKIAHGLLLAYWMFYIVVLALWGALEPWSW